MGLYVEIKQRSIIKKALPPSIILGKALATRDDIRSGCTDICAYLPEHIGRGIYISWNRKSASVSLPMFALPEEIREFYNVVDRISKYWSRGGGNYRTLPTQRRTVREHHSAAGYAKASESLAGQYRGSQFE